VLLQALFPGLTTLSAADLEALALDLLFVQLALEDGGGLTPPWERVAGRCARRWFPGLFEPGGAADE
jgi:hypothetical protein